MSKFTRAAGAGPRSALAIGFLLTMLAGHTGLAEPAATAGLAEGFDGGAAPVSWLQANHPSAPIGMAAGRTHGRFAVSQSGAASYRIPLWTPPGVGRVGPALSLAYDSRAGNGVLGVGWSLDGLSVITRCNRSRAQDGAPSPVTNSLLDRYCLDGQALKLTSAQGTHGLPGSTYATEIETFARVTAQGVAGAGPASFTVTTRNGLVYEYGTTADSRIHAGSTATVRSWALARIHDRAGGAGGGNALAFRYHNDATSGAYTNGSFRLAAIDYPLTATGAGPFYTVEFTYGQHAPAAVPSGFLAGYAVVEPNRLERIDVRETGSTLLRSTFLGYEQGAATGGSRLNLVQECSPSQCLAPTRVGYREGERGWQVASSTSGGVFSNATSVGPLSADLNGDGRGDLVYPVKAGTGQSRWWVAFGTANGFGAPVDTGVTALNHARVLVGHFDGGHAQQLLVSIGVLASYSNWHVLRYGTGGFALSPLGIAGASEFLALDYDGDGLDDLASITGRSITMRRNTTVPPGAIAFAATKETIWRAAEGADARSGGGNTTLTSVMDFDGDGRADLAVASAEPTATGVSTKWYALRSGGFGTLALATRIEPYVGTSYLPLAGDWNGDGCSDLLASLRVLVSNCAGGFSEIAIVPASVDAERVAVDWDGDGRTDLLHLDSMARRWTVQRSTGTGVEAPQALTFDVGNKSNWFVGDFDGDGLADLGLRDLSDGNRLKAFRHAGMTPDLATSFTDGYGQSVAVSYLPITQGAYTPGAGASFPYVDYQGPLNVVERHTTSTAAGASFDTRYSYVGARLHLQGRGFVGFASRTLTDSRNGVTVVEDAAQAFPYSGWITRVRRLRPGSQVPLSEWSAQLDARVLGADGEQRQFPYVARSTAIEHEFGGSLDGAPVGERSIAVDYDAFGSPTRVVESLLDRDRDSPFSGQTWSTTTDVVWQHDPGAAWCLGLPASTTVTNVAPGQPELVHRVEFEADLQSCRLVRWTSEPDAPALRVVNSIAYDDCGNPSVITVQGANPDGTPMAPRSTRLDHGARCQLPVAVTNAMGDTLQLDYDYAHGQPRRLTDANGLITDRQYDAFGRPIRESRPDGTATTIAYESCADGSCWGLPDLRERVWTAELGTDGQSIRQSLAFLDGWGQARQVQSQRAHGVWTTDRMIEWDSLGRATRVHRPFDVAGEGYTAIDYDLRDRPVSLRLLDASGVQQRRVDLAYAGHTTSHTDALQRTRRHIGDPRGLLRRVVDPAPGGTTAYDYDSDGRLVRVIDPVGATATAAYDGNGVRTRWSDADAGEWRYTANSLGERVAWTDGNGKGFSASYDLLGRMLSRKDLEGTSTFEWGNSAAQRNRGSLVKATGHGLTETREYDPVGRLAVRNITSDQTYRYDYAYNSAGLLDTLSYPESPVPSGQTAQRLRIQYGYSHGYPVEVRDVSETLPRVLWMLDEMLPDRQPAIERLGGARVTLRSDYAPATGALLSRRAGTVSDADRQDLGYEWNSAGELTAREERLAGRRETFDHDALGRLLGVQLDGSPTLALRYDAAGNVLERNGTIFQYGDAARPNRLTADGSRTLAYDGNGNVRTLQGVEQYWTSYGLPSNLRINGRQGRYSYGPNRELWRQIATYANGTETTWYAGGLTEKLQSTATGTTKFWRHYVPTPSGEAIVVARSSNGNGATSYLLTDHLGSSDLLLDENGAVRLRASFDAFGARRGSDWSSVTPPDLATVANTTRRGYTGHHSLDNIGLVHMRGRVYDPSLGRFLSADPVIGDPSDSQSLNPYAYVGNRPLEFVDPSGFSAADGARGFGDWLGGLVGFSFYHRQYAVTGPPRRWTQHSMPAALPGVSAQSGVAPCRAGNTSPGCSGSSADGTDDIDNFAGQLPLEMQAAVIANVSGPEIVRAIAGIRAVWNTDVSVNSGGRLAAVAWDGDPASWMAPRANTATIGERILGTSQFASVLLPIASGAARAGRVSFAVPRLADEFVGAFRTAGRVGYGPANPGPLADDIAATFRSGSYSARTLEQPMTVFRVIGDNGRATGSYWTAVEPRGPLQSAVDLGLDQNWGNTATRVIRAELPPGTTIYEGAAAAQRGLVGGGSQIYVPRVDLSWLK
jgi:RHS repeat-associated protein